ncbi:MAG: EpsI family protein [Pyrinomonadaceae bacterium]|nr:EpsI family protein [Pyrinomonadaceae bacterium]
MPGLRSNTSLKWATPAAIVGAVGFLYFSVISKLGYDWWTDENYSHGLLVPIVIGVILWLEREKLAAYSDGGSKLIGSISIAAAFVLLLAGTLGSELFTQRISLLVMAAAIVTYFFGRRMLLNLAVPFGLLFLAIPIPQIIFNRIAFPLQLWASQVSVWGIRLFEIPVVRKGNVIDILPRGATQTLSLEVVEACSGIRSLMTLVTLALVLSYFTRRNDDGPYGGFTLADLGRTILLMVAAVPIAVFTNAGRVMGTGILTFYYGRSATDGIWHDVSGWLVYVAALAILIIANFVLRRLLRDSSASPETKKGFKVNPSRAGALPVIAALILGGLAVNWFVGRGEVQVSRTMLSELPKTLGTWGQRGDEIKFGKDVEAVLRTTDYTMREYTSQSGRVANIYIGYYSTQRTGATYHSPQNCLPGAGWVMSDPQIVTITTSDGRTFNANRYLLKNGVYNEVMIYWYQGRGRIEASEYEDKLNTVFDSITRRRTDGAMVRVMTSVGADQNEALSAASDLAARLAEQLPAFIPE